MKKKNKLVKRIVALGLVAVLVAVAYVFIFGRNNDKVTKIVLDEIPIISYFGITGETTTEADIIVVERDLNNTIMTNGYAVKLFLAPRLLRLSKKTPKPLIPLIMLPLPLLLWKMLKALLSDTTRT